VCVHTHNAHTHVAHVDKTWLKHGEAVLQVLSIWATCVCVPTEYSSTSVPTVIALPVGPFYSFQGTKICRQNKFSQRVKYPGTAVRPVPVVLWVDLGHKAQGKQASYPGNTAVTLGTTKFSLLV
jgi:hypothetical protein